MKHKAKGGARQPIHLYFVIITDYPHITTALPFAGEKGEEMRLIDADALMEVFANLIPWCIDTQEELAFTNGLSSAYEATKNAPTIDAVPVVRCKDCKYWDKDTLRHNSNDVAEWDECECEMLANRDRWNEIDRYCCDIHFCADGERKDDEVHKNG